MELLALLEPGERRRCSTRWVGPKPKPPERLLMRWVAGCARTHAMFVGAGRERLPRDVDGRICWLPVGGRTEFWVLLPKLFTKASFLKVSLRGMLPVSAAKLRTQSRCVAKNRLATGVGDSMTRCSIDHWGAR